MPEVEPHLRQRLRKRAKRATENQAGYGKLRVVPLFWSSTGIASTAQVDELIRNTDKIFKRVKDIQVQQEALSAQQEAFKTQQETSNENLSTQIKIINKKVNAIIMGLVKVEQSELDQLDADLDAVTAKIKERIDAIVPGEPIPDADLSALKADVDALAGLGTPPAEPVEPEPAEPEPV